METNLSEEIITPAVPSRTAVIYVFSGTGNTFIAAEATAAHLKTHHIETTLYKIEKNRNGGFADIPDPNDFDLAGFAYPIHAFNAPQFFLRFVKQLPTLTSKKAGMPAFLFKTSGEPFRPNNASSFSLCRILKKKGFLPCIDLHMLMPYNIVFRYPDAMAKQMYLHTVNVMAPKLAEEAAGGKYAKLTFNPITVCWSYLLRLQWFGAWINGPLHRVDKTRCTGCGLCAAKCPSQNIKMIAANKSSAEKSAGSRNSGPKQLPHFEGKCTMCMRCTMNCPQDAIKPGFLTLWKVNPAWNYHKLLNDNSIPDNWTDNVNAKYFRLFRNYYKENS